MARMTPINDADDLQLTIAVAGHDALWRWIDYAAVKLRRLLLRDRLVARGLPPWLARPLSRCAPRWCLPRLRPWCWRVAKRTREVGSE